MVLVCSTLHLLQDIVTRVRTRELNTLQVLALKQDSLKWIVMARKNDLVRAFHISVVMVEERWQ